MQIKKYNKLIFREYDDIGYLQNYEANTEMIINKSACVLFKVLNDAFENRDNVLEKIVQQFKCSENQKQEIKNDFNELIKTCIQNKFIESDVKLHIDNSIVSTNIKNNTHDTISKKRIPPHIYTGFFITTEDCNNRCVHCYNSYTTRKPCYMSRETFDKALKDLVDAGAVQISISGGEALIHPDAIYFLQEIKKSGLRFRLYSNAQNITDEICEIMSTMQISPASITLYSLDEKIHDAITQNKGSWKNTIHGLRLFKKYNIPFLISVPITNKNIENFEQLFDFCIDELGATNVGPNPFISYTVNHNKTNQSIIPTVDEIKLFAEKYFAYQTKHNKHILPIKKIHNPDDKIFHESFYGSLTVLPQGEIVAGTLMPDLVLGNVNNDNVLDVWKNSSLLNEWRNFKFSDLDMCMQCSVNNYCMANIGDNWVANHDLLKCDQHLCELYKAYYETLLKLGNGN